MAEKFLHYDVLEKLGEGAKSIIYRVSDPGTGRTFALKHVTREGQKDIRYIEQMETEYEISSKFTHPGLRRSFDLKINKKMFVQVTEAFLVMEYFDGRPLDERPPATVLETVDVFIQVAEALRAMHQMGYVHADLKPNNILRNGEGVVKVIDFGQSCKIGTVKERIQGTPEYISPEQVIRHPITVQTDVFNLGATLYWALVGRTIPTLYTVNKKGDNSLLAVDLIETPMQLNPRVPQALSNLVMESISTNPKKRPADIEHVIHRLELSKHILMKPQTVQSESTD